MSEYEYELKGDNVRVFYYWCGKKYHYHSTNLTHAMNRKQLLRQQYPGENQPDHFHYFNDDGERHWL